MHLQYQSVLQARKALSKDGKVFGDWLMVGVKPCIDKVRVQAYYCSSVFSLKKTSDQNRTMLHDNVFGFKIKTRPGHLVMPDPWWLKPEWLGRKRGTDRPTDRPTDRQTDRQSLF